MLRVMGRLVIAACLLGLVAYVGDWLVFSMRLRSGSAWDSVEVSRVTTASLKGNKEAYYPEGTDAVPCSRSMFPMPSMEGSTVPCWWLRRHHEVVVKY